MIRVMKLWNGIATAVWTGYSLDKAFAYTEHARMKRLWIDDDKHPSNPGYGRERDLSEQTDSEEP